MKLSKKLSKGIECKITKQVLNNPNKVRTSQPKKSVKISANKVTPKATKVKAPVTYKTDTATKDGFAKVLNGNGGRFFSCEFTKKDGSHRKIHCRLGAKGVPAKVDGKNLLVYDLQAKGVRTVNLDTVETAKVRHTTYKIV